ncbi:MAG: hypothetical protein ACRYFK_07015 [Janthinobacterium lividum]
MPKILRLHRTGSSTHEGWGRTGKLGRNEIEGSGGIQDPEGGRAERVAVAIPSPFARLHLVETALAYVSGPGAGGPADTVHHRLVGQFWDLWELTFNYYQRRQPGQRLLVRTWHRQAELAALEANPQTRPLAQALALYLNDRRFASLADLHLLYWPGATPQQPPQLLGGTSPLTLFFPAPAMAALPVQRPEGGGHYFDGRYVALGQRERAFQDYVYQLFVADRELARLAPAVRNALDPSLLAKWDLDGTAQLSHYPVLADHTGNPVAVAGVAVRVRPDEGVVRSSDFTLAPTRQPTPNWPLPAPLPLVLRPGLQAPGKHYYNNTLLGESGGKVPVADARALPERTLPGPELNYPYLTVNDLLEETLLTVPYQVDDARFVTGQLRVASGYRPTCWPLLPVKPAYFDYFTAHDLSTQLTLELEPACVRVRLRLPVAGGFTVDYERAYYPNPQLEGLGRLLTTNVGLSVFPFLKVADAPQYNDWYKVMLVDANNTDLSLVNKPVELEFGVNGRLLSPTGTEQSATAYRRTAKTASDEGSTYYEVRGTHFDYLRVHNPAPAAGQALVVPRWPEARQGTKTFRFAIDFGTTNTHVAYHDAPSQPPQPLGFGPEDTPVALLKKATEEIDYSPYERLFRGVEDDPAHGVQLRRWQRYQQREFVPPYLGAAGAPYQFPIRTATSEAAAFSIETPRLLANVNVGFGINTEEETSDSYHTNLKWGETSEAARHRVREFFREMLLLFRCQAAAHGGNLAATQVVWFAPLSFSDFNRELYRREWDGLFREVFHTDRTTTYLPESSAPYFFLTRRGLVTPGPGENAAFVDIGGGTTDVLFYADQPTAPGGPRRHQPAYSTSFRFAGNDLWGDGAAEVRGGQDNGLVRFGLDSLAQNPVPQTKAAQVAFSCLRAAQGNSAFGSEEIANRFFNYDKELQFSERLLRAQHLRVLFYLHFGALVYHLGQLTALRGLAAPRYLCFTGRGSLYLRLLCPGSLRPLEQVAGRILSEVLGALAPANFKIILADDPKQTTANGGVLATGLDAESTAQVPPIVQPVGTGALDAAEARALFPADITEEVKAAVLANVERCLTLLLTDPELVAAQSSLGIKNPPGLVLRELQAALADSFNLARQQYANTLPAGEPVPETLFFLPFKNALYVLSQVLHGLPG